MFIKSIRWRMQLWQAFLLVCVLAGFGATAYQLHRTNRLSVIDEELEQRVMALSRDTRGLPPFGPPGRFPPEAAPARATNTGAPDLERPPGPNPFEAGRDFPFPRHRGPDQRGPRGRFEEFFENRDIRLSPHTASFFDEGDTNGFYYLVWSRSGNLLRRSTNAPATDLPARPSSPVAGMQQRTVALNREAYQFTDIGECVLVGRYIASDLEALGRFAWWLVAAGSLVLALGLGGGWWVAGRALRPVDLISVAASRISAGHLGERINVADTDSELGRLVAVLNSTFARLEAAFAQQKQFTADASHELRTPLAVLISETQTTLARERTAAEYRQTVESCLETAQQMRQLTGSLLELARYDAGQERLERRPLDLAGQASACIERVRPLARARGIQIHNTLAPAPLLGDAERLNQALTNLLVNAIHYNKDNGEIRVTTAAAGGVSMVTIADTGAGISPEDCAHIFERFYRADKSRAPSVGHSGLGLAICKAIIDAHGGNIEVKSQPGVGTTFTIRLPDDRA
jgi:heavy metal sensor kinase